MPDKSNQKDSITGLGMRSVLFVDDDLSMRLGRVRRLSCLNKERISSRTLEYLLYKCGGYTINAHCAQDDAEGLPGLLLGNFPVTERPIFRALLEKSEELTSRICAVGAPYHKKEILKQRGYRWNDGSGNGCKGWWTEVPQYLEPDELGYLSREIYPDGNSGSVDIKRIDAYTRFSVREE